MNGEIFNSKRLYGRDSQYPLQVIHDAPTKNNYPLPITHYQLPITNYQSPKSLCVKGLALTPV